MKLLRRFLAPLLAFLVALAPAQPQLSLPIAPATVLAVSAVTAAINFTPLSAGALTPAEKPVILGGIQSWSFPGSSADLYFARNAGSCAINRLLKPCASLLTTTRASTGFAQWTDGHLSSFAANAPRITDQGLLVEQASTNLALQSQALGTTWVAENGTVTPNNTVAPDGTTTGTLFTEASSTAVHDIFQSGLSLTGSATYTTSIYAKAGTNRYVYLNVQGNSQVWYSAVFDLAGGGSVATQTGAGATSGAVASTTETALGNGWFRLTMVGSGTMTAATIVVGQAGAATGNTLSSTNGQISYLGSGRTIFLWGAQLENLAFATSYIPTTTVAVTRAADVISLTGAASTAALAAKAAYVQSNLVAGGTLPRLIHYSGGAFMDYASSTTTLISNATNTATATMGSGTYTGLVHNSYGMGTASITAISNNGTKATSANAWAANTGTVYVGSNNGSNALNGYMPRLALGAAFSQFDGVTQ